MERRTAGWDGKGVEERRKRREMIGRIGERREERRRGGEEDRGGEMRTQPWFCGYVGLKGWVSFNKTSTSFPFILNTVRRNV